MLIVYGCDCTWWGSIDKAARTEPLSPTDYQLPCCPHCGCLLFQIEEDDWWNLVAEHAKEDEDYIQFIT